MKKPNVAIIARSIGLEYDDRIRKECCTLAREANLFIFVNLSNNIKEEGITSYEIPYKSFHLKLRELLPPGKFLLIKAIEFYLLINKYINKYDYIYIHEEYTFIFALLSKKKFIILGFT